ncbi:phospholipid methyltransferase [Rhizophagus irregularis]|uniref:Phosphatidyl-N-methylethanolamine N-methyltransferase n=3 Tax=Rhizophagus irregularis TaxID=588596 RepID=A0A2I1FZE1_9GLOM|nr:phospholipid methyltransferase-domain-containing protein [Rhizophagus irregularis DAOM 181602=DAOM 197198]EXX70612.1 bifunctional phosphatidyl-N-methylethanolamine N-methyltransferase/phosphatidyl-N-dimethylethanolamine N-methyltransferase [Rhizophagus irregularis DAOM 197198w]PKC14627.1 phospholipid methyltransferase [Rhizophagus irregularis]PKC70832.1 phospholipid methyltransferase [Rhizophagus irregularis]PKK72475.1 phospholipid methyltransferase [Rhizophagus irregularis]PKY19841.1 phosp|eukprot:XP_025188092.1 phospholipid methyltransferase-domain-containing protein [Rhizophagus irregularis DAOM 181602=DAOM 197198]
MYQEFLDNIDFSQKSFWISFASITFNPLFWNFVARREHKTRFLTRFVGGNPYIGCYCLAIIIFFLGIFRDILYKNAIDKQQKLSSLDNDYSKGLALVLFFTGNFFVLSSMYVLGVTGTYLGDYFGILMDDRITSFPFNVLDNPMYYGSSMVFLSTALWYASPAGIILTCWAFILYLIALRFEGPFTSMIYAQREEKKK